MIRIYPSKLQGEPLETHELKSAMTVEAWLRLNVPSFDASRRLITVTVNGQLVPLAQWSGQPLFPGDTVDIHPEARGSALATIFKPGPLARLFGIGNPFAVAKTPSTATSPTSKALGESNVKGNQVKLNDVIREVAGRRKIYPDYVVPLRRYFRAPRAEWTEMLLCLGVGYFEHNLAEIFIGDTPLLALGADVEFTFYEPGADLTNETAAIWWHSSTEVGSTSTGTAGLELTAATAVTPNATVTTLFFGSYTISAPTAAEFFPETWTAGTVLRVIAPYSYTVASGGVISGSNLDMLAAVAGMQIEIVGAQNSGTFYIGSVTEDMSGAVTSIKVTDVNGNAVGLAVGTMDLTIGPAGLLFQIASTNDETSSDGVGPSSLQVVRLGPTGAVDNTFPGFDSLTTANGKLTVDPGSLVGGNRGPFPVIPANEVCTQIQWDVFYPQGLFASGLDGKIYPVKGSHIFEYRDMAIGGAWTAQEFIESSSSPDAQGYTHTITLPYPMRPEARIRKTFNTPPGSATITDTVQWYGLRGNIPIKKSYEGVTLVAIRVRGGDRIASQSEQLVNVLATRKLPYRSGGAWQPMAATRRIDAFAQYVAKSIGYTDADLDLAEFDRLGAVWATRGDTFDDMFTDTTTVKDAIARALIPGFAEFTLDQGEIRPVRDEPRTTYEHMYTPQNMTDPLERSVTAIGPDEYNGVDVQYTNAATWQVETIPCRLPGDAGTIVETYELNGVTDYDKAWRIGMRRRRIQKYRRWSYAWSTELDGLNSSYLSYCAAADDVPGYGQSALLLGYSQGSGSVTLESSEPFDWGVDGQHVIAIRRLDGSVSGPWYATRIDDYTLSISGIDFIPDTSWEFEPPHLLFGPLTRWCFPVLVTSIEPDGTDGVKLEAVNYDGRVYLDDDNLGPE